MTPFLEGETLCTIDTDKSTNDFELYDQGYIAKILVKEGTADLPVGAPIAVLVSDEASRLSIESPAVRGLDL